MELYLEHLSKSFGSKSAVNGFTYSFGSGVYGLLGANGAGKTTLMRMVCGLLRPTGGQVLVDGQEIHSMGELFRLKLGYLPQEFGYYPDFYADDFLYYIAALKGLSVAEGRA